MGKDTFLGEQLPDPFENRVGAVLEGRWTIEQLIGAGGMAAVYRVTAADGRVGAAKVLHTSMARIEEVRARFMQEAMAVSRLEHPAVVRVFDSGKSEDGCPFLVMELLDGQSLAERIEVAPLSPNHSLQLAVDLLDVLAVAHASHIIHRDIKPENIFLLPSGNIKLLDFGVARVRRHSVMHVVTQEGTALGTPHYMPQEQIKGVGVDHRADLFAVGAVLFELLTGRTVHEAHDYQALLVKMLTQPAPPLASVWSGAPPAVCAVVDRALSFEAADRYPDAPAMLADLHAILTGQPSAPALSSAALSAALSSTAQPPAAQATPIMPTPPPSAAGATVAIDATLDPDEASQPGGAAAAMTAPDVLAPIPAQLLEGARPPARPKASQPAAGGADRRSMLLAAIVAGGLLAGIGSAVVVTTAFGEDGESVVAEEQQDTAKTAEVTEARTRGGNAAADEDSADDTAKPGGTADEVADVAPAATTAAAAPTTTSPPQGSVPGGDQGSSPPQKRPSDHARDHIANQLQKARRKAHEHLKWPRR